VGAVILKGFNFMHFRHTIGKKVQMFFNDNDLFGVSAILCSTFSIFLAVFFCRSSTAFFAQNTTCFQKHVSGQVVGKCLESPGIFVEIPQKLEVPNRTFRRSQVFLHF
jgi:hypothetical protein